MFKTKTLGRSPSRNKSQKKKKLLIGQMNVHSLPLLTSLPLSSPHVITTTSRTLNGPMYTVMRDDDYDHERC